MFLKICLYKVSKYLKSFIIILIFNSVALIYALDYTDFILNSNRNANEQIFELIIMENLEESIQILRLLGMRDDPYVEDIIYKLISYRHNNFNNELLLENLLQTVILKNNEERFLWMRMNKYAYFELIKNMYCFNNTYLKSYIVSLMEELNNIDIKTYIMYEMQCILNEVNSNGGYLLPGSKLLLYELLKIIKILNDSDYNEIILNIIEETRDIDIVENCRNTVQ